MSVDDAIKLIGGWFVAVLIVIGGIVFAYTLYKWLEGRDGERWD